MKKVLIFCLTLTLFMFGYTQSFCEGETVKKLKKGQIVTVECDSGAMIMSGATFKKITANFSAMKERDSIQRKLNALYTTQISQNQKDYAKLVACYDSLSTSSKSFIIAQQSGTQQILNSIAKIGNDLSQAQQSQKTAIKNTRKAAVKTVLQKVYFTAGGFSLGLLAALLLK